jgi:CopG family nickel-responsive transcriptional regulator
MMERMSATLDVDLLRQFDGFLAARGYTNRSEALRDLIRAALIQDEWRKGGAVVAVVTLVYDHHHSRLQRRLLELQHEGHETIVSSTHVHLDGDHCLEVLILRGPAARVRALGDRLVALPGVLNGALSATGLPHAHG